MLLPAYVQHREHVDNLLRAVIHACDPGQAVARHWSSADTEAFAGGILIGAGKASVGMASELLGTQGLAISQGVLIMPAGNTGSASSGTGVRVPSVLARSGLRMFDADHPLPTQRNMIAAQAFADAARLASSRKLPLIVLLSGGASAHLTLPVRGLTLSDIRTLTEQFLRAGANISELNCLRKKIEQLKGGGLARMSAGASVVRVLVMSDVIDDRLDVIASGPMVEDSTTLNDAIGIIDKYQLRSVCPNVADYLDRQLKAGPVSTPTPKVDHAIIASNRLAIQAAQDALVQQGFEIVQTRQGIDGDAGERGRELAQQLIAVSSRPPASANSRPQAIVWGGETTVQGVSGGPQVFGGRNQEAALAAAIALVDHPNLVIACLATDGIDGLCPPAGKPHLGGVVTAKSCDIAQEAGLDAQQALAGHQSYSFLRAAGAALESQSSSGSGTNVNDLWVGLSYI